MSKIKGVSAILLLSTLLAAGGCDPQFCCTNISTGFHLSIVDQNGNDLLDPAHPDAITKSNTDLYYLENGEMEKKQAPRNFSIETEEKQFERYAMRISTSKYEGGVAEFWYLEFEDESTDTIRVQYKKSDNSTYLTKIWYNDKLRWDAENNHRRFFTVTHEVN